MRAIRCALDQAPWILSKHGCFLEVGTLFPIQSECGRSALLDWLLDLHLPCNRKLHFGHEITHAVAHAPDLCVSAPLCSAYLRTTLHLHPTHAPAQPREVQHLTLI
jgi:hypothetical protein